MHHPSRPLTVAVAVAAVSALLTACTASTPPAAPTAQTFEVPDSAVAATVTTPDDWDRAGQAAPLVVRSTTPSGDPGFTANVVVTTSDPGTATLEDRTAEAAEALQTSSDVAMDPTQPGPVTVAGLPAYRLGATRTVDGIPVTQVETVVEVATPAGSAFVYVTETFATDDTEGAAQARAVTDSLVVTPAG
ncbi:hypothetical protein ACFVQ3_18265 [Oerskovia sp. NPDC057915]|uniref:hypothetical protein n=1 Tax=Oerskovia sp. NPDC057915 TaxID=3346280 RepID=UPI0036DE7B8E